MPERWPALLQRHRAIIRGALAANGGFEVLTEGDGSYVGFALTEAVAYALREADPFPAPDA
jgi:class 3 adenylate cyclase